MNYLEILPEEYGVFVVMIMKELRKRRGYLI